MKDKICGFNLCSKCADGVCTLEEYICDLELQREVIADIVPAMIKMHNENKPAEFAVKAKIAADFCRHSGDTETSNTILQLLSEAEDSE